MTHPSTPNFNQLVAGCRNVAHMTGIPAEWIVAHGLLFGTALVGGKVCYRKARGLSPHIIGSPVTVLSDDEHCPGWFKTSTSRFQALQETVHNKVSSFISNAPSPAMMKRARTLMKQCAAVRDILPDPVLAAAESTCPRVIPDNFTFIHDLLDGTDIHDPGYRSFGPDILALAPGDECYRRFFANIGETPSILTSTATEPPHTRVTLHGWGNRLRLRRVFRQTGMDALPPLGLLLEFPPNSPPPFATETSLTPYTEFFEAVFAARLGPNITFLPGPELVAVLDKAVTEQAQRAAITGLPPASANPIPALPWNLSTALWLIERQGGEPRPENNPELVARACTLATHIHANHLATLHRIFPPGEDLTPDPTNAAIIDKLSVSPLHLRELTRKFHRISAGELLQRLSFLTEAGLTRQMDDGRWIVPAPWTEVAGESPSPVSAEASTASESSDPPSIPTATA
ncbi:MAG: winged helix-turn-helix transcriptional regulator [Akkermansiaceae bacterium]|nr:winged helix-turn-helix transcriptional regulator [Akkermansiaceae bacterium]